MEQTERTTQAYDELASCFADKFWQDDLSAQLDRFCALLRPGARVADVGCGPGRDLLSLTDRGFWAVGLDRSAGMLRQAALRGAGRLVQADVRALPFASDTLGGIWACASLLHLPKRDLPAALTEMRRVLGHGHVYLSLKEGEGESWRRDDRGQCRFFAYYGLPEVETALERAGFRVIDCRLEADSRRPDLVWISAIGESCEGLV